jgi:hypothetical protein
MSLIVGSVTGTTYEGPVREPTITTSVPYPTVWVLLVRKVGSDPRSSSFFRMAHMPEALALHHPVPHLQFEAPSEQ